MNNEQWEIHKADFDRRIRNIVIPPDINPGSAKPILARLDALYTDVMIIYSDIKATDDFIGQILSNALKTGAIGSNPDVRAANAVSCATEYDVDGEKVNLFNLKRDTSERLTYINAIIKILEGKQARLITALGLMKIESSF